jgi:hypothetical protein
VEDGASQPDAVQRRFVVVGVVVAGAIATFTSPGEYSVSTTMLGFVLVAVLLGFGGWPVWSKAAWREIVGYTAAAGFVLLLVVGVFIDRLLKDELGDKFGLYLPPKGAELGNAWESWKTLVLWLLLTLLVVGAASYFAPRAEADSPWSKRLDSRSAPPTDSPPDKQG